VLIMKKTYLIPLVLVVLGLLVPVVYAATRNDHGSEILSSASVEPAVEEEKTQDEVQKNQRQDLEEQDADTVDGKKEQSESAGTAVSNKESSSSQDKQKSQSAGQPSSSSQGNQKGTSSGDTTSPAKKDDGPAPGYVRVTVTIVGKNGNIMYNSAKVDVKENGSVLDALYASGVSCKVTSDGYVEEISGLAEKSTGEGWMYSVNGGAPPGVGAGSYTVSSGDRIIWYYGSFMDPPPKL
jgi:cobalamin biosynthesis Mg chelatase CobN